MSTDTENTIPGTDVATQFPQLFGIDEFSPTLLQCQALIAFAESTKNETVPQILKQLGHDRTGWYRWQKQPGFLNWWNECIERSFKASDLMRMYKAMLNRAIVHDTAAGKIIAQRFDPKYTERSSTDTRHTFAGYVPESPESVSAAIARSRKRVESQEIPEDTPSPAQLPQPQPDTQSSDETSNAQAPAREMQNDDPRGEGEGGTPAI